MFGIRRTLICAGVAIVLALGCSSVYDTDDLRGNGGGDTDASSLAVDAGGDGDGNDDAAPDGGGSQLDAASVPDAAPECSGAAGTDCNGDPFSECDGNGTCLLCGHRNQPCCLSGAQCDGLLGVVCAGTLCL